MHWRADNEQTCLSAGVTQAYVARQNGYTFGPVMRNVYMAPGALQSTSWRTVKTNQQKHTQQLCCACLTVDSLVSSVSELLDCHLSLWVNPRFMPLCKCRDSFSGTLW